MAGLRALRTDQLERFLLFFHPLEAENIYSEPGEQTGKAALNAAWAAGDIHRDTRARFRIFPTVCAHALQATGPQTPGS